MSEQKRHTNGLLIVKEVPKPKGWDLMEPHKQDELMTQHAVEVMMSGVLAVERAETENSILFLQVMGSMYR